MSLLGQLLSSYSFNDFLKSIVSYLGPNLVYVATGYLILAAFFVLSPSSGPFSGLNPRAAIFHLLQQIFYPMAAIVSLLFIIEGTWYSLGVLIAAVATLFLAAAPSARYVLHPVTYDLVEEFKRPIRTVSAISEGLKRGMLTAYPSALLLFGIVVQILVFDWINPSLPIVVWVLVVYFWSTHFFAASTGLGITYQISIATRVKMTLNSGKEYDGYLVGKGSDHYQILTKDADLMIPSSAILTMERVAIRKGNHPNPD